MPELHELQCIPCRGGEPTLSEAELAEYLPRVPGWEIVEEGGEKRLRRSFKFKNFAQALEFTNRVGAAAEAQDHHPRLVTEWGRVTVDWWTHVIGGLHQNDFIMAARTSELVSGE